MLHAPQSFLRLCLLATSAELCLLRHSDDLVAFHRCCNVFVHRTQECKDMSVREIARAMADEVGVVHTRSQQSGPHPWDALATCFAGVMEQPLALLAIVRSCSLTAAQCDIIYFSARKLGCARGGGICIRSEALYNKMRPLVPLYEGFLT